MIPAQFDAQRDSLSTNVYFDKNVSILDLSFHDNGSILDRFTAELKAMLADTCYTVQDIYIRSGSTLEGAFNQNLSLSRERAEAVKSFLMKELNLPDDVFSVDAVGEDWEAFYSEIISNDVPDKEKVLNILDKYQKYVFGKRTSVIGGPKKELMDLNGGKTWFWFEDNIFPEMLSKGNLVVCHYTYEPLVPRVESEFSVQPSVAAVPVLMDVPSSEQQVSVVEPLDNKESYEPRKAEVRLGTNLLYDVATIANLTFEIGFAQNFAFNVLTTFSPWNIKTDIKMRTLLVQPELRYYFANDFKGHYLGAEGHFGWFNMAFGGKVRYQDKNGNTPLWGAGLTYGYALPFSEHWGMDFSISAGYAHIEYDCFYNIDSGAKYITRTKDWWGPTKVGISIYYQF